MNILILFDGECPGFGAAFKRIRNYQKGLQLLGNKVEVLSIFPATPSFLLALLFLPVAPFYLFYKLMVCKHKPEILFVYGFGWFSKLLAVFFGKLKRIKTIFEVNEKPYSIVGSRRDSILKYFHPLNNWLLTRWVYPHADGFVVISEKLRSFASKYKSQKSHVVKIPIIVDYEYYQRAPQGDAGIKPYIIHSASLNDHKDGISEVFQALALAIRELGSPIHFYLTSLQALPSFRKKIDKIIETNGMKECVHFLSELDDETLLLYQQRCAAVIINKVISEQNVNNFSSKIGEYAALGKPIITTRVGEVSNYFKDNLNCLMVEGNDPRAIAERLVYLLKNPEKSSEIGNEAKKTALSQFDYKQNCGKMNDFFEAVLTR